MSWGFFFPCKESSLRKALRFLPPSSVHVQIVILSPLTSAVSVPRLWEASPLLDDDDGSPPLSAVSLSVVSATHSQPQILSRKMPEINNSYVKLHAILSSVMENRAVLLYPAGGVNHPFVQCPHAVRAPHTLLI